jgi:oxygen-independent coproporphyrinogen-3 oxidase
MRHVYVHVPFCRRRCVYCDFAIAVRRVVPADRYVAAVRRELAHRVRTDDWNDEPLETLYLGGGTPSLLSPDHLAALVQGILEAVAAPGGVEITVEANPDDVTPAAAARWVRAGVNRVSLGVQSFAGAVLAWMHRTHDAASAGGAARILRDAGVRSLSADLIFGLPDAPGPDALRDLERVLELRPDHLSVYGLTVEPRTPLGKSVARGAVQAAPEERFEREFLAAHDLLTTAGFEHYEVSNYARPGHRSRHNAGYWTGRAYAGLGPSAHGFTGVERYWNEREWAGYERAVRERGSAVAGRERLTPDQRGLERFYLGLRTVEGVPVPGSRGVEADPRWHAARAAGWLLVERGRARLTPAGWLRLDELALSLTTSAGGG